MSCTMSKTIGFMLSVGVSNICILRKTGHNILVPLVGDALKKLEERGVVIRFVIGRRLFLTLKSLL